MNNKPNINRWIAHRTPSQDYTIQAACEYADENSDTWEAKSFFRLCELAKLQGLTKQDLLDYLPEEMTWKAIYEWANQEIATAKTQPDSHLESAFEDRFSTGE